VARARSFAVSAAFLPFLLLGACASLALRPATPDWPLPDPALAPFNGRISQDVELIRGGSDVHFLAVLDRQKDGVLMVGLSPLGQRLLRVRWTARGVDADIAPQAAPYLDAQAMLRELSFALWPPESLDAAFKNGPFHADCTPGRRVLWQGNRERLVVGIHDGPGGREWTLGLTGQGAMIKVRALPSSATQ
jgi:uncharacterized protein DUF3261